MLSIPPRHPTVSPTEADFFSVVIVDVFHGFHGVSFYRQSIHCNQTSSLGRQCVSSSASVITFTQSMQGKYVLWALHAIRVYKEAENSCAE